MHPSPWILTAAVALLAGPGLAQDAVAIDCAAADPDARLLVAERALARGLWPLAAESYACAARDSTDAALAERATRGAFENFQLEAAAASAARWLELDPGREEAHRYRASSLLRLHRDAEALAHFAFVLDEAYDDRGQGFLALLSTLNDEPNDLGAARVMESLAQRDPGLAEAQYGRSVLWQRAENGERALEAARRALELRPGWRLAELAEVRALLTLGRTDEGLARAAGLAADGDPLSQLNQAWFLVGAGRETDASAVFEDLRRSQTAVVQALEGLGTIAFSRRDNEAATRYFSELAQQNRLDETALAYLGLIADRQDNPAAALRFLERVETGPRAVPSQLKAYQLMVRLGAPERAEQTLAEFLSKSPESTRDVVVARANQLAGDGRSADAIALLDRASAFYPDDDDLRLAKAFLLERDDRVREAIVVMRDVLRRRPDDATTLNSLGYTLVDRTPRVREGYELVLRAIEAKPDSYAIMDSVGWALFRLERRAEAIEWLERAWQRSRDPEVAAHLGEVFWAEGRRQEARDLWSEALEDAPDNRTLQQTLERHPG